MTVNTADVEAFRKIAQEKVWPAYKKQYPEHLGRDRRDQGVSGVTEAALTPALPRKRGEISPLCGGGER